MADPEVSSAQQTQCPFCDRYDVNPAGDKLYRRDATDGSYVPLTHQLDGQTMFFTFTSCDTCHRVQLFANGDRYYPTDLHNELGLEGLPPDIRAKVMRAQSIMDRAPEAAAAMLRRILHDVCLVKGFQPSSGKSYVDFLVSTLTTRGDQEMAQQACLPNNQRIEPGQIAEPEDGIKDDERVAATLIYLIKQACASSVTA